MSIHIYILSFYYFAKVIQNDEYVFVLFGILHLSGFSISGFWHSGLWGVGIMSFGISYQTRSANFPAKIFKVCICQMLWTGASFSHYVFLYLGKQDFFHRSRNHRRQIN